MSKVVVLNHVTLDGVMQAPGRPDEERRGDALEWRCKLTRATTLPIEVRPFQGEE